MTSPASDSPEGVTFLTSLLVRFPEVGSARLCEGGGRLQLYFYLQQQLEEGEFRLFKDHLELSWEVFFQLQKVSPNVCRVSRSEARRGEFISSDPDSEAEVDSLQIERDLDSLSTEELSLLVTLVREAFSGELACDEDPPEEEASFQEEMLHRSLQRVRSHPDASMNLTGFRDEMRVLIYSNDDEP